MKKKKIQCIALNVGALLVGLAIPIILIGHTWEILRWFHGQTLGTPNGPKLEDRHFFEARVALCLGILLSASLWYTTVYMVWRLRSVRVAWFFAIILAIMYWLLIAPKFHCLCLTGLLIVRTINIFLVLLALRFLIGLSVKESRRALAFYIPLNACFPIRC